MTSLSLQLTGSTSLSPGSAVPAAVPRRTSARRKKATAWLDDGLVSVTLVTSLPPGPGEVAAATWTGSEGRFCRAVMSAYWLSGAPLLACGLPSVVSQSITSCWVDIQYTLRSTTTPCWRRVSSTK